MATQRIREFLDESDARYVIISHSPAYTADEVAASIHMPGKFLAKAVVVKIDDQPALAVVPANREIDLERLRNIASARDVRLAGEDEFADRFTGCQPGTVPPFGNLFGMDTYVDRELARQEQIVFNAGTHTDVVCMTFAAYRRRAHPKLASIASEPDHARSQFIQI